MDQEKKPRSREKKVVSEGRGVEKRGEGLGIGPVGNTGNYADRKEAAQGTAARPVNQRPAQSGQAQPFGRRPAQSGQAQPFSQRPAQSGQAQPFGQRPAQSGQAQPFGQRPAQSGQAQPFGQRPAQSARPAGQRPAQSARPMSTRPSGTGTPGTKASGSGCSSRLFLVVIALLVLLGGGKLSGLFDQGSSPLPEGTVTVTSSGGVQGSGSYSGSGSAAQGTISGSTDSAVSQSGASGLTDLLSSFLGSSSPSVYDYSGDPLSLLNSFASGGTQSQSGSVPASSSSSSAYSSAPGGAVSSADTSVSSKARARYTSIRGNGKDEVTVLVYLCGTDLESQNGMGTSDLKEMAAASLGKNVNLIVYTGGCRRWRNNVLSSTANQIYQIQNGKLYCLEKDLGTAAMTDPGTLTEFIRYGAGHFPANRMCLILWDHGGGSVTGYGYDERYSRGSSMSLAGLNTALKNAGQKFDFIGFDACLMATVENGLMLSQYADYMIASEETEPGVGWYYTNWLTRLGKNPSLPTVEIGKSIADDFVEVCSRQCRGQATTLSVVDLAELEATVPSELKAFSQGTSELIRNQEYKTVATARSKTREFAQSTRIDQIDLVHFARNMGTKEGTSLAKALQGAIKYNRTGSISSAYGLSIYFPYKRAAKVSQMVSTYQQIGMDEEYSRCIQEFASLELSGQFAAGTPIAGYGTGTQGTGTSSLLSSLLGGGGYSGGISSSPDDMSGLLEGLFGGSYGGSSYGGSSADLFSIFSGRSLTSSQVAEYLSTHHLDASSLVWKEDRITLSKAQWSEVDSLARNVFVDDGAGYIDLGMDSEFILDGNSLVDSFDGTCLSIGGQPIAYYYLDTEDDGENYAITGYTPAYLNGERVSLMLRFDNEHPYGFISGAAPVYMNGETEAQAKNLIRIGAGDTVQFLCEYYDYDENYRDTYYLGSPVVLDENTEIANTPIGDRPVRVTYCFTDYYQQRYWTPARIYGV